ncbi:phage tail tape measure protein [Pseudoflavonifractor capillosus]|uniref:phage tail tape measure protein n=1 Tax=Pseudoflavonifractor capillosus TaxID=106588 RepID=UPI00195E2241|nr:phage tail tape measure protein [Pseudoflavonifractor capillosus]MBM6897758.1 phage tail tape measure protein [Pseudoflavonifractor capillosus]
MASRKEYEMLFQLNAQLGSSYTKTFKAAQDEITSMQKEIQSLSKTQSDITAYQKQQSAVEATRKRLELLQQQYENIQQEIEETGQSSSDLKNKLLAKQMQIDKTTSSLGKQTQKLDEMGDALREAGVDMDDLGQSSVQLSNRIDTLKKEQEEATQQAQTFGNKASQAFGAVHEAIVAAGIATALKEIYQYYAECSQAAMDFESAITGVAKTTDLTEEELSAMSDSVKEMSTEIPATTDEISAVAEAAGQLGIAKESLLDFTEVMVMMGTSTNMSADEAATALARFANITGTSAENYSRLGSVIVGLGNNFATTEKEITEMATRLASAGTLAGLSESEILALAAAMSSVGIEAEAGGTAMTQTLNAIETAVVKGGDALYEFARISGMSSSEFATAWENDAVGALQSFIAGLGALDSQGESAVLILDDLGLTGVRQANMLKSLALASEQLGGAVSLASQEWKANTALTTEASKRYATAQSQLTMMQNAYKNLKVAIGDAYTPALQKAYAEGTKLLNAVSQFVKQNPALVNAVVAFTGVMGTVVAALTAYTAAMKLAEVATTAFATVSSVSLGPIFAVTAAVAAVTAGVVALATAAANDAAPSVDELTQAAQGMREAMDEANATYDDTVSSTMAAAGVADSYISKLEAMEEAGVRTEEEHREYHNTLALLCQVVPDLAEQIDLETDTINGGTAALRANTEAWKQNAIQQAYQEQLTALYKQYSEVLIEAEENSIGLTKAKYELEAAEKKQTEAVSRMNALWEEASREAQKQADGNGVIADTTAYLTQEYYDLENALGSLNEEVFTAQSAVASYEQAIEEGKDAASAAEEEIALAEEAINNLTDATQAGADATGEAANQEQELQSVIVTTMDAVNSLTTAYTEAYETALDSVSGQYQIWEEAAEVVATSAGTINSALESQISYWEDYNENLQSLRDRSADIQGLSDVIASFADGSADSVNAIAGMASASDEELATMVSNWQDLQAEQEEVAGSVADLRTDFSNTMDELQADLAEDIEAMDLSTEAAESAKATIQGYISGATGMLPQVQAAYANLASAAQAALGITGGSGKSGYMRYSAYASGTEYADPGFALVGEHGPELVWLNGGEQIMTAEETAALRDSMSVEAMAFAPQLMAYLSLSRGIGAISAESGVTAFGGTTGAAHTFNIIYNVSGTNATDIISDLEAHNDDLVSLIRSVIEEDRVDALRVSYS